MKERVTKALGDMVHWDDDGDDFTHNIIIDDGVFFPLLMGLLRDDYAGKTLRAQVCHASDGRMWLSFSPSEDVRPRHEAFFELIQDVQTNQGTFPRDAATLSVVDEILYGAGTSSSRVNDLVDLLYRNTGKRKRGEEIARGPGFDVDDDAASAIELWAEEKLTDAQERNRKNKDLKADVVRRLHALADLIEEKL